MNREHRLSKDKPYPSVGDVNFPKVVRNAVIDEPESEVTIAPAEQANLRDVSVMPNAALTTVENETFLTLGDPAEMTSDQLADAVIEGVKKLKPYLPYIRTLKNRFDTGDRDSTNRLKTPIRDCSSWKEFCEKYLDRTPKTIREALADKKSTKTDKPKTENAVKEIKELADAIPLIRNGRELTPPSQYSVGDIVETVTRLTDNLVNQRSLTPSDRETVYYTIIRKFQDILTEMQS